MALISVSAFFSNFTIFGIPSVRMPFATAQSGNEYTVIFNASSTAAITSGWVNPTYTYVSDNNWTYSDTDNAEQEYAGYGFNFTEQHVIKEVYVGVEGYTTNAENETLEVAVWNGSVWISHTAEDYSTETMQWINFTADFEWNYNQANQIKTRIRLDVVGVGCYPNKTYTVTWNGTDWILKNIEKVMVGDLVLGWDLTVGLKLVEVIAVDRHEGNWTLVDVWSGNVTYKFRNKEITIKSHVVLTEDHSVFVYSKDKGWRKEKAGNLRVDVDYLGHLYHDFEPGKTFWTLEEHYVKMFPVENITKLAYNGTVYNIRVNETDTKLFLKYLTEEELQTLKQTAQLLGMKLDYLLDPIIWSKTTYIIDWLPVKIVYTQLPITEAAPKPFGFIAAITIIFLIMIGITMKQKRWP